MAQTQFKKAARLTTVVVQESQRSLGEYEVIVGYEWYDTRETFTTTIDRIPSVGLAADLANQLLKNKSKYEVNVEIDVEF